MTTYTQINAKCKNCKHKYEIFYTSSYYTGIGGKVFSDSMNTKGCPKCNSPDYDDVDYESAKKAIKKFGIDGLKKIPQLPMSSLFFEHGQQEIFLQVLVMRNNIEKESKKILTVVHQVIKNLRSHGIKSEKDIPMTKEDWTKLNERNYEPLRYLTEDELKNPTKKKT